MTSERRLAAIMFTDLVSYSALAERNEALAIQLLEETEALVQAQLPLFAGKKIKSTGDGMMIEFGSALQAVECALAIQKSMRQSNAAKTPEAQLAMRVGIHVGDVVYRDGDVLGDGVNLAARIEPLAEPGGICISRQVFDQVHKKIDVQFVSLGPQKLKNIEDALDVFKVMIPGEFAPQISVRLSNSKAKSLWPRLAFLTLAVGLMIAAGWYFFIREEASVVNESASGIIESLAVVPFENLSADGTDDYFSDGMTEEVLDALSKVEGLRVISRTSVFSLKGQNLDSKTIGTRLNVDHVLEGSVRRIGDEVKISVDLIDVKTDTSLWRESYERRISDVFAVQEEIAKSIVNLLKLKFLSDSDGKIASAETTNVEAHENYLKGRFYLSKRTGEGFQRARTFFQNAIEQDPLYAKAYAGLSDTYSLMANYGHLEPDFGLAQAKAAAEKALEISPNLGEALTSLAFVTGNQREGRDLEESERLFQRAIELSPNYATAHHWYSLLLEGLNKLDAAIEEAHKAHELDPLSPIIDVLVASHYNSKQDYKTAKEWALKALEVDNNFVNARELLVSIALKQNDLPAAEREAKRLIEIAPNDYRSHITLAGMQLAQWKWDEALSTFRGSLMLETPAPLKAQGQIQLALVLSILGRVDEGDIEAKAALALLPDEPELLAFYSSYIVQNEFLRSRDLAKLKKIAEPFLAEDQLALVKIATQIYLAYGLVWKSEFAEALALIDSAKELAEKEDLKNKYQSFEVYSRMDQIVRAIIYAKQGEREKAQEIIKLLEGNEQTLNGDGNQEYWKAVIQLALGDIDAAFEGVAKGIENRHFIMAFIGWDPVWDPYRADPRYAELLAKMGITGSEFQHNSPKE